MKKPKKHEVEMSPSEYESLEAGLADLIRRAGEEIMRKKRRQKRISAVFDAPFIEDVAEPVTGYKKLLMGSPENNGDNTLHSHNGGVVWPKDGLKARCLTMEFNKHPSNEIPHPECTCGIYAYDDLDFRLDAIFPFFTSLIVKLKMGGYVLPHTQGFRASIAKISAIYIPSLTDVVMMNASYSYGSRSVCYSDYEKAGNFYTKMQKIADYYSVPVLVKETKKGWDG